MLLCVSGKYGLIHTGGMTGLPVQNHKVPHPVGTCTTADDQVAAFWSWPTSAAVLM